MPFCQKPTAGSNDRDQKGKADSTMTARLRARLVRRGLLPLLGAATLALGGLLAGGATSARAATQEPCDIYAAAGTPCVAAHSTTRALYAAYSRPCTRSGAPRITQPGTSPR